MKVYYYCDICGKMYANEKDALECEKKCKEKLEAKSKKKKEKEERVKEIETMIEKFINDYGSFPEINCELKSEGGMATWRFRYLH